MNLVPWFPEVAVGAGLLALVPGLRALRGSAGRPRPRLAAPASVVLGAAVLLNLLIAPRTGAALALGGATGILISLLAVSEPAAWGAALLGLGALFEIFGGAAGMDEGGWKLLAQLVSAFALGSALVAAVQPADGPVPEAADAGIFGAAGALVIAAATPFVANRVDGVALPVLVAVAGLVPTARFNVWIGAGVVALLTLAVARGLDPVALGRNEYPVATWAPGASLVAGVALGVVAVRVRDKRWALGVLLVTAIVLFHAFGPYGVALGAVGAIAGAGLRHRPGVAATFLTAAALFVASHSGTPLVTPSHLRGWVVAGLGLSVVAIVGVLGRGSRIAVLRILLLEWIVIGPLLS